MPLDGLLTCLQANTPLRQFLHFPPAIQGKLMVVSHQMGGDPVCGNQYLAFYANFVAINCPKNAHNEHTKMQLIAFQ